MYQTHDDTPYSKLSCYSIPSLGPSIPNPTPHFRSLSSDSSFPNPTPAFNLYPDSSFYPTNYSGFEAQPSNYHEPNPVSSSWVVKQVAPVSYSPAIQALRKETIASTSYDTHTPFDLNLVGQNSVRKFPKKYVKRPKRIQSKSNVNQAVRCELCKIDCNNIQIYEKHLSGKKHGKNLQKIHALGAQSAATKPSQSTNNQGSSGQKITPGGQDVPGVASNPPNLEAKKQKLLEGGTAAQSLRVCTICNVACNGEVAFADHLVGKKHINRERGLGTPTKPNAISVINSKTKPQQNTTKKRAIGGSSWCEVCKISCTSSDGLEIHRQGKKHKRNLQKLKNSISNTPAPAPAAAPTATPMPSTNLSTEVPESSEAAKASMPKPPKAKKKRAQSKEPEDVETKKRKILECGAAAGAVRTCDICNIVCNSETVFNLHLAGQKHAAMLKQAEAATAENQQQPVTTDA